MPSLFLVATVTRIELEHFLFLIAYLPSFEYRYISGYKNRYQNFIRYLRELGDEVLARILNS